MRKLNEIAGDLRDLLSSEFQTVRISVSQNHEQRLEEIRAINPDKLPGVIVALDNLKFNGPGMTSALAVNLILVDQFRAGSDDRALSVFQAGAALIELFPADGREINGVWYYPVGCIASSPDAQYAALEIGIEIKQGSI